MASLSVPWVLSCVLLLHFFLAWAFWCLAWKSIKTYTTQFPSPFTAIAGATYKNNVSITGKKKESPSERRTSSSSLFSISHGCWVGHKTSTPDPSFSPVPQVCLRAAWKQAVSYRPHRHPLTAKSRSVNQSASQSEGRAKMQHQASQCVLWCMYLTQW